MVFVLINVSTATAPESGMMDFNELSIILLKEMGRSSSPLIAKELEFFVM